MCISSLWHSQVVRVNLCSQRHAPDLLVCLQAPGAQLSIDLVEFTMLAAHGFENAATKQSHKRKRQP